MLSGAFDGVDDILLMYLVLLVFEEFDLLEDEEFFEDADEGVVDCMHHDDDVGEDEEDCDKPG